MAVLPIGIGSAAGGGYQIERSLRFNSADSAYLNRTVGSAATSNTLTTFSFWFKRAKLGTSQQLFASATSAPNVACYIELTTSDTLKIYLDMTAGGSDETTWTTSAVFRDVSAWYGATIKVDTSQASNANKVVLYINNVSQTLTASQTGTAVSTQRILENGISLTIGKYFNSSGYGDFYLTEFYAIDGQALTPSSFGETDSNTGVWKPKAFSGAYGTNGFYLKFADNSGTTSTTLGKDSSGNGNNWTPNNFSVTAGAGNDSLVDSPTSYGTDTGAGGEVRGNYCTLNPLRNYVSTNGTISNGNLQVNGSQSAVNACAAGTMVLSGKMYWEFTITTVGSSPSSGVGILPITYTGSASVANVLSVGIFYLSNGNKRVTGTSSAYGSTYTSGDIIGIAVDVTAETITFYKNNVSQGSISGTGVISAGVVPYIGMDDTGSPSITANFGQRPFAYTAPSGFKALCTQNLPTPTIGATSTTQANDYMNVVTYTGNSATSSAGTVARTITGVGFQPDLIWVKSRNNGGTWSNHSLTDAIRGNNLSLSTNATDAEINVATGFSNGGIGGPASDGFTIVSGTAGSTANLNSSSGTYVAWNWKANGAGSTNTAGTITSTVSANTTSGFSIVTFNIPGSGTSDTVGHGLGVAPSMVILKPRTAGTSWGVYHSGLTSAAYYLTLQTTNGQTLSNNWWNSTAPTSSVFTIGATWYGTTNAVAYCFAPVAGYSAFGSYTGNGSADGPFVFTNFRPRYLMVRRTDSAGDWIVLDTARDTYNLSTKLLYPNLSNAEETYNITDILSNGFKQRNVFGALNASGGTYIYMALAENPFKYSLGR